MDLTKCGLMGEKPHYNYYVLVKAYIMTIQSLPQFKILHSVNFLLCYDTLIIIAKEQIWITPKRFCSVSILAANYAIFKIS